LDDLSEAIIDFLQNSNYLINGSSTRAVKYSPRFVVDGALKRVHGEKTEEILGLK